MRHCLLLASALAVGSAVQAHDTWFAPQPDGTLTLATGNRFPVAELAVDEQYFVKRGCRAADGSAHTLEKIRYTDTATLLRIGKGNRAAAGHSCFVQLTPFEFELPADKIEVYFKEIRPSAAVLAAWAELKARGLPFIERYTKSARIEIGTNGSAAAEPVGVAMDALRVAPAGALTVSSEAVFELRREGRPLADFNIELVNERSPVGLWHRTDAQGRIRARLPLTGRWLLRGTDLRLAAGDATRWESQFITYAFEVGR
jgi:hypothetical protein